MHGGAAMMTRDEHHRAMMALRIAHITSPAEGVLQ